MMNERIKQLAEQAGMYIVDDEFSTYGKFAERFAQLIVAECVDICLNENVSVMDIQDLQCGSFTIQDMVTKSCGEELSKIIKKRFGVEE